MPDWTVYDPQLQQCMAEGMSTNATAKRLGLPRQTVVDRLRKLGLKAPQQGKPQPPQEPPMNTQLDPIPTDSVTVLAGQMVIEDADTPPDPVAADEMLPIGSTLPVASEALSIAEVQSLEHYEEIISQGIKTFVEVGHALVIIRDERLYRERHQTFEDYLRQRWDLSSPYAYRLMDASAVVEHLLPIGSTLPVNEAQARPLTTLAPEQQVEVWQEAVKTAPAGKVTAAHVKNTVKRLKTGTTEPKVHKPKMQQPEPIQPAASACKTGSLRCSPWWTMIRHGHRWENSPCSWLGLPSGSTPTDSSGWSKPSPRCGT